jgi:hypothetical protein
MISDILSGAVFKMNEYLEDDNIFYKGSLRADICALRDQMDAMRARLDGSCAELTIELAHVNCRPGMEIEDETGRTGVITSVVPPVEWDANQAWGVFARPKEVPYKTNPPKGAALPTDAVVLTPTHWTYSAAGMCFKGLWFDDKLGAGHIAKLKGFR